MPDYFSDISELSIHQLLEQKIPLEAPRNRYQCFIVPDFQRKYAWDKTNWEKFWEDVEAHTNDREVWFLGSMITLTNPKQPHMGAQNHDVIDGQQRITTIFIFRIVLYVLMKQIDVEKLSQANKRTLDTYKDIIINVTGNDRLVHANDFITASPNRTRLMQIYDYYTNDGAVLPEMPDKRTKYYAAFDFFKTKLESSLLKLTPDDRLNKLLDYYATLDSARLIWAQVTDLSQAMSMFEVLNNRGKPLGITDIVKTTILHRWLKLASESVDQSSIEGIQRSVISQSGVHWQTVQKLIQVKSSRGSSQSEKYDDTTSKRFIRHFYILYAPTVDSEIAYANLTERDMLGKFDELMKKINTQNDMNLFRATMLRYAVFYGFMRSTVNWEQRVDVAPGLEKFKRKASKTHLEHHVSHLLNDINHLGLVQINLLLLYIFEITFRDNMSESEYIARIQALHTVMSTIMRFVLRRNITDTPKPNEMDTLLSNLLGSVATSGKSVLTKLGEIDTYMKQQTELSNDTLRGAIQKINFDDNLNTEIRFILHFLEKWNINKTDQDQKNNLMLVKFDSVFDGFMTGSRGDSPEYQIEHIMPQSLLNEDYEKDTDEDTEELALPKTNPERWVADLTRWNSGLHDMQDSERAALIHSIGNLTFLSHNSKLSDKVFSEKQHAVNNGANIGYLANVPAVLNDFPVSRDGSLTLRTTKQWTEREIEVRTRAMNERLLQLLALGGSDQKQ
jgi:hypothetical protein